MVHWLQFDGMNTRSASAQLKLEELRRYLSEHPEATAIGYLKIKGDMFARFARLDCCQDYDDLDMECNSLSDRSLKRFDKKPCHIEQSEYITKLINS